MFDSTESAGVSPAVVWLRSEVMISGIQIFTRDMSHKHETDDDGSTGVSPALSLHQPSRRDAGAPVAKGWYSRRYLPHCDVPGLIQAITFRLDDALPAEVVQRLQQAEPNEAQRLRQLDAYLDAGHGACLLRQQACADIVEQALLFFDPERYRLLAWCVMPNHVHVLIETRQRWPLAGVVQAWKSFTAKAINTHLQRGGSLWQRDYFDRFIRDDLHLAAAVAYIQDNPVRAGLVERAEDWPFGSARLAKS